MTQVITSTRNSDNSNNSEKYNDNQTRQELIDNPNAQADKELLTNVYRLHEYLGALGQLPDSSDSKQRTALRANYFNDWLNFVILKNNRLPLDIPVGFIFVEFSNGLVSGKYERKGNNIATFAEAMSKAVDDIIRSWKLYNKPKALPPKKGTRLENLSDEDILNLWEIVNKLGRDNLGKGVLFSGTKADSYFNRLDSEYERRFAS